ncbi:MAG: protein kinase domain-containing protein [Aggregatilineales bacterium]
MTVARDEKNDQIKDPLIGQQLGDYRLTSLLASGGMARVYKGIDHKLQRQAAVKVLEQEKIAADNTLTHRFRREARAVAALEHENIITIYQYGEEAGVYFLAMKLVRGRDLAAELKRLQRAGKRMPVERALRICEQVAAALDYAHAAGVIHRDVKPSNILLDKNDKAVLTDFGLVLRTAAETTLGTAFGTPRYIAPEQAVSSNKAVPQSDIYSLGVILYELLTGQTPFNGETPMQIALSHISDPPPPPRSFNPDIPPAAEAELLRALDKEPARRHRTASEMVRELKAAYGLADSAPAASVTAPSVTEVADESASAADESTSTEQKPPQNISVRPPDTALSLAETYRSLRAVPARLFRGVPPALILLIGAALFITALFVLNGLGGAAGAFGPQSSAPVAMFYGENWFVVVNQGDYTLDAQPLVFVRGVPDAGRDDFPGDRIPSDILPPGKCFLILQQNTRPDLPEVCQPLAEKRHMRDTLLIEPRLFFWRREAMDGTQHPTFSVHYSGREIVTCPTVRSGGGSAECRFNWPVPRDAGAP